MSGEPSGKARASPLNRWLREPLLHFLLIGGLLFAIYGVLNPQSGDQFRSNQILSLIHISEPTRPY